MNDNVGSFIVGVSTGIAIGIWAMRLFICPVEIDGFLKIKQKEGNIEKGYYKVIKVEKGIEYKEILND